MHWKDLLYFSTGEKRALFLVLALIGLALIALQFKEEGDIKTINQKIAPINIKSEVTRQDSANRPKQPLSKKSPIHKGETKGKDVKLKKSIKTNEQRKYNTKSSKYPIGTVIELNRSDSLSLMKIPGIASTFSKRIIKFRSLLGGFYCKEQLKEVYGLTSERYEQLAPWFSIDASQITQLAINKEDFKTLVRHPYLDYKQTKAIFQLRRQKKNLTGWVDLILLEEFTEEDQIRLMPYLSFE